MLRCHVSNSWVLANMVITVNATHAFFAISHFFLIALPLHFVVGLPLQPHICPQFSFKSTAFLLINSTFTSALNLLELFTSCRYRCTWCYFCLLGWPDSIIDQLSDTTSADSKLPCFRLASSSFTLFRLHRCNYIMGQALVWFFWYTCTSISFLFHTCFKMSVK